MTVDPKWTNEMNLLADTVVKAIVLGRQAGLTSDGAVVAALIGVLSVIRVDNMNEEALFKEAKRCCTPQALDDFMNTVKKYD